MNIAEQVAYRQVRAEEAAARKKTRYIKDAARERYMPLAYTWNANDNRKTVGKDALRKRSVVLHRLAYQVLGKVLDAPDNEIFSPIEKLAVSERMPGRREKRTISMPEIGTYVVTQAYWNGYEIKRDLEEHFLVEDGDLKKVAIEPVVSAMSDHITDSMSGSESGSEVVSHAVGLETAVSIGTAAGLSLTMPTIEEIIAISSSST